MNGVIYTSDTFFNGRIRIKQSRSGYRFSVDAVLLAHYAKPRKNDYILDLGTGCGIIPLLLAYRHPDINIYGIEVQKELADIAILNVKENCMENRIAILCMDMKELKHDTVPGPIDLVISNPPFRKADSGRINPDRQRAVARHEIKATLNDVVETASRILTVSGKFVTIYSAERTADILTQMKSVNIEPKYLRMIHSGLDTEAKLILLEGVKGARQGLKIGSPLIIYNQDGSYTDEVKAMFLP